MLKAEHLQEWRLSAVHEELVKLNVESLDGYDLEKSPKALLLEHDSKSTLQNGGFSHAKKYTAYNTCDQGGWIVWGEGDYFQFKPDFPRTSFDGEIIKYESPRKVEATCFKLKVPWKIGYRIAKKHGLGEEYRHRLKEGKEGFKDYTFKSFLNFEDKDFWNWIKANPQLPIIITEGAKKAGALLTAGYVAIALPGVTMGYRSKVNGIKVPRHLIPHLEELAVEGREFVICFDQDKKLKTVKNVNKAISRLGTLLSRKGCKVSIVSWHPAQGKGVDDFISGHGEEEFSESFLCRHILTAWKQSKDVTLDEYVSLDINERYIPEGIHPDSDAKIIGIQSAKGTGKTEWLVKVVEKATEKGQPVLVLTHRIQLGQALCNRFGIDYVTELRTSETKGVFGYGLCVDSLHPTSQARFNPSEWENALILVDECEQVFWHLLDSNTCQSDRKEILRCFTEVLQIAVSTGGKVYLSDADLSPIALNYVQDLLGGDVPMWVLRNNYKPVTNRKAFIYNGKSPTALFLALDSAIARGEKVIVHVSSQKVKSKWSTQTLEEYFSHKYPDKNILRIDSETVANPNHRACGCIAHLNELLPEFDIVLASPTIETGVSIDVKHFDSVWCIAWGIQTVDAVLQTIERVRDDIPRHIWANERGLNFVGNNATSAYELKQSTDKVTRANILLLNQASEDECEVDTNFQEHLTAWSKRGALVNVGMWRYRDSIFSKLKAEGYQLESVPALDKDSSKIISEVLEGVRDGNYEAFRQEVIASPDISDSEYDELKAKRSRTDSDNKKLKKAELKKRYAVEPTEELIKKDDNGWYPQIRLHYFLTIGKEFLASRDRAALDSLSGDTGKAFSPDISKRLLGVKVKTLELLNVEQFFNEGKTFTNESLGEWFEKVLNIKGLKDVGLTVTPNSSPIRTANRLLDVLGSPYKLKFISREKRSEGETRIYQAIKNEDGREEIFEKWLQRDLDRKEAKLAYCREEISDPTATSTPLVPEPTPEVTPEAKKPDTEGGSATATSAPLTPQVPNNIYIKQTSGETENLQKENDEGRDLQGEEAAVADLVKWFKLVDSKELFIKTMQTLEACKVCTREVVATAFNALEEEKQKILALWAESLPFSDLVAVLVDF